MKINIEINEDDLKKLVLDYIEATTGIVVSTESLKFEVKTNNNYKADWEEGRFRVNLNSEL